MNNKLPEKDGWYWWRRKFGTAIVQVCNNGDSVQFLGERGDTRERFNEFVSKHWAQSTFEPVLHKEEILAAFKVLIQELEYQKKLYSEHIEGIEDCIGVIEKLSTAGGRDGR